MCSKKKHDEPVVRDETVVAVPDVAQEPLLKKHRTEIKTKNSRKPRAGGLSKIGSTLTENSSNAMQLMMMHMMQQHYDQQQQQSQQNQNMMMMMGFMRGNNNPQSFAVTPQSGYTSSSSTFLG